MLTLRTVADNPQLLTKNLTLHDKMLVFRPLVYTDVAALTAFFEAFSDEMRHFTGYKRDALKTAQAHCDAIARYDKLRFVLETDAKQIVGLLEFSFALPGGDRERYDRNGIILDSETDCRFGPVLADDYQDKGVGSQVMPVIKDIARKFGKSRIILWGGVLVENVRAIHFYEKHGFQHVGKFINQTGDDSLDMILDL
ncbi:MAG: GNAT family N-acetyltransferase [Aggregatilineales bacterium]